MTDTVTSLIKAASAALPSSPSDNYVPVKCDGNGVLYVTVTAGGTIVTTVPLTADNEVILSGLACASANLAFDGAAWDRVRASGIFKSVAAVNSGNTAVWTPTSGKKFRLLAWRLSVAGTLAADGTQVIQLRDGTTTVIARCGANVSAALPSGDSQIGEDYGATGQLSSAANNVLNVNLGTAMATGAVYIDAWGTEE